MKTSALKAIIKESVKEAIHEELKDILLEAVRTPKVSTISTQPQAAPVVEHQAPQQPVMSVEEKRAAYRNILGDTSAALNTSNVQSFVPQSGMDVANGTLPPGEVDMSQIMGLMNNK